MFFLGRRIRAASPSEAGKVRMPSSRGHLRPWHSSRPSHHTGNPPPPSFPSSPSHVDANTPTMPGVVPALYAGLLVSPPRLSRQCCPRHHGFQIPAAARPRALRYSFFLWDLFTDNTLPSTYPSTPKLDPGPRHSRPPSFSSQWAHRPLHALAPLIRKLPRPSCLPLHA